MRVDWLLAGRRRGRSAPHTISFTPDTWLQRDQIKQRVSEEGHAVMWRGEGAESAGWHMPASFSWLLTPTNIYVPCSPNPPYFSLVAAAPPILYHCRHVSRFPPTSRSFSTRISPEPHPLFSGTGLPLNNTPFLSLSFCALILTQRNLRYSLFL